MSIGLFCDVMYVIYVNYFELFVGLFTCLRFTFAYEKFGIRKITSNLDDLSENFESVLLSTLPVVSRTCLRSGVRSIA